MVVKVYASGIDNSYDFSRKIVDIFLDVPFNESINFDNVLRDILISNHGFIDVLYLSVIEISIKHIEV